jgi:hypothetical protein
MYSFGITGIQENNKNARELHTAEQGVNVIIAMFANFWRKINVSL